MSRLVIDASVAIKWVVPESGTDDALIILEAGNLAAPDLLIAECANILWKKTRRGELLPEEAIFAARIIEQADIDVLPSRDLLASATRLAIELDHPAYDCLYLELARRRGWRFVTADDRLVTKSRQRISQAGDGIVLPLGVAAAEVRKRIIGT